MNCIFIADIVPKERIVGSKRRKFKVEGIGTGRIKVSYDAIKGRGPKPFIFPERIELNEKLAEAVGLYVGDGKLSKDLTHSEFTNKDSELAKFMFDFFLNLGVKLSDMTLSIDYRDGNENKIKGWWANKIGIGPEKFRIGRSERYRYSTLSIQVNGVVFRLVLGNLIQNVMGLLVEDNLLRRGFLRGLFAAEGCIAIKEGYINHISIAFNPKTERDKAAFYKELLRKEGIETENGYSNKGEITVRNWKNYHKLWEMTIFDLCHRKKEKFMRIVRGMKVYCSLNNEFRKKLFDSFGLYQREIAKLLGSYQANISRTVQGYHLLSIEQLITASDYIGKGEFSIENIISNTEHLRVGNLTDIRDGKNNFLQTLFDVKSTKTRSPCSLFCQGDRFRR